MLCIFPLWVSVNFTHYFNWTRFLACYRINYQTHFLLFLEMSPYPIFIQFSSSLSCSSVQSYKLLGQTRTVNLELCNTFWTFLLNTRCMAVGFWADKLYSKSHAQKFKCGFCKVFSYFLKTPLYDCCYAKMQPGSALGCIAFPPIDFKMNKLSLGIWEFIAAKTYSGRSTQALFIGLNSVCHLKWKKAFL